MTLAASSWVTARLSLGGAVVALLLGLSMFAPGDLRARLLMGSLLVTLVALVAAALRGNRWTYQAAGVSCFATLVILFAGSFATSQSLPDLALAGGSAVGLVLASLPRAPPEQEAPPSAAVQ